MNGIYLTKVSRLAVSPPKPSINFFAGWLTHMGFVPDSLFQLIPEPNGLSLTLCENIPKYSELARVTRENGGELLHVNLYKHKKEPNIHFSGAVLGRIGFSYDDILLVRYEYGFIRMRKLPQKNSRIVTARLFGQWLEEWGFVPESVITVDSADGLITCRLQENGRERTHELVKYARKNKLNLLQVTAQKDNSDFPRFEIPSSRFEKAGLNPDGFFLATGEYGRITLQQLDFDALGF